MNQKDLFIQNRFVCLKIFPVLCFIFVAHCTSILELWVDEPETGVVIEQKENSLRITATSKASDRAIEKDSTAMMQTTSREAGRLMIISELTREIENFDETRMKTESIEFIKRGKFAITVVTYDK